MSTLRARKYTTIWSRIVMVVVFAAVCTLIASAELWKADWVVTPGTPAPVTLRLPPDYFRITLLRNEYHYLPASPSGCSQFVARGTVMETGSECAGVAAAFENYRRPANPWRLAGFFAFFVMVGYLLSRYMSRDDMGRSAWMRSQATVFVLLVVLAILSKALLLFTGLPFQVLPVTLVPLLTSILLGRRLAFATTLSAALVLGALLNFNVQAVFIFIAAGLASVSSDFRYRRRTRRLLIASIKIALVTLAATVLTTLLFAGTLDIYDDLAVHYTLDESIWMAALGGGLSAGVLAVLLLPPIALMVGEVPRQKLFDLQELDHPLLLRIRQKAPSTWEHSRAMANMAEGAVHAIGGNTLLVRVGAYFHDVGKSLNPQYFIENQSGGENPHDSLSPEESARAIFRHVVDGVSLLRKEGVPEDVVEFALTHHGTSVLEYFWSKTQQAGNPRQLTAADFSYPGNKPATREAAVLMIVDAMEAASRTVDQPSRAKFDALLQKIVFGKMIQGQFDESGLTMADLRTVISTLSDSLVSIHHGRIKYPWQNEPKESSSSTSTSKDTSGASPVVNETDNATSQESTSSAALTPEAPRPTARVPSPPPAETTYTGPAPSAKNPKNT